MLIDGVEMYGNDLSIEIRKRFCDYETKCGLGKAKYIQMEPACMNFLSPNLNPKIKGEHNHFVGNYRVYVESHKTRQLMDLPCELAVELGPIKLWVYCYLEGLYHIFEQEHLDWFQVQRNSGLTEEEFWKSVNFLQEYIIHHPHCKYPLVITPFSKEQIISFIK